LARVLLLIFGMAWPSPKRQDGILCSVPNMHGHQGSLPAAQMGLSHQSKDARRRGM
jgi:hypothetical protein